MIKPLISYPPPIGLDCRLVAHIWHNGEVLVDTRTGAPFLVDLSGGASTIEWWPNLQLTTSGGVPYLERCGSDTYSLRVWKRRHGWIGSGSHAVEPFNDVWADWLDEHRDLRFLMAGVEFMISSICDGDNGVNYWLTGWRVST